MALVDAHVNKQIYAFLFALFRSEMKRGPAKSIPVLIKGGPSSTRDSGKS